MAAPFLERRGNDVRLRVRLTPGARQEGFGDVHRDADGKAWLKASVRAVPEKGRANDALLDLLYRSTGIAVSRLSLAAGDLTRTKTVEIRDCTAVVETRLAQFAGG